MEHKGINYGHNLSAALPYKQRVKDDLRIIWDAGYRTLRPAMPPFDVSTASHNLLKFEIETALGMGFDVITGYVSGGVPVTPTRQADHLAYVTTTFKDYANSLATNKFFFTIDNEIEEKVSGGLTISQAQDNILAAAATLQGTLTHSTVDVATAGGNRATWAAKTTTALDYIGANLYYGFEVGTGGFTGGTIDWLNSFGSKLLITEWSTAGGFPDTLTNKNSGDTYEQAWGENLCLRQELLDRYNIPHMVFSYGDGSFGLPTDAWALRKADGSFRQAWYMLNKLREY